MVGSVPVGGDAPVTVQTMTNTPTADARATIDQIRRCEEAGVDIIRVSCPDQDSTAALREIVRNVNVPIVADIHFHYKRALEASYLAVTEYSAFIWAAICGWLFFSEPVSAFTVAGAGLIVGGCLLAASKKPVAPPEIEVA